MDVNTDEDRTKIVMTQPTKIKKNHHLIFIHTKCIILEDLLKKKIMNFFYGNPNYLKAWRHNPLATEHMEFQH